MENYKQTPLWNNRLTVDERLDYLVGELTLEEKFQCLTTGCPTVERLGIKATNMGGEAAHGIEARHDQAFNAGEPEPTTSFTQPIGMSMSFDRALIRECGRAVGEEARALFTRNGGGGLCRWAPTIDMERDPRWGRTEEAYGEDPYLTGEMASAYIQGMKGEDPFYLRCGATLKHFYANNVEKDRIRISSSLDGRNKYEYYLEPFRKAITEGGAEAVMTSYNEINGIPALVNPEVQKLLKDTWGLPGHVVCDGADMQQTVNDHKFYQTHAETIAGGLKAGLDCFTDDKDVIVASVKEAFEKGMISMEDIDHSIRNSFRTRIRLGFFDGQGECPYTGMGEEYVNSTEHQEICARMTEEACVLLKNEEGVLPIKPEETEAIAVVGPLADVWYKDWYCGIPPYSVTVLDGIRKAYPNASIDHESGLSQIRLSSGGRYVGLDQDGRLRLTEDGKGETFLFTDWGCGSTTLRAVSNDLFVTLDEDDSGISASKQEAFGWFIRESWNLRQSDAGKKEWLLDSWNHLPVGVDADGYLTTVSADSEPAGFEVEIVKDGIMAAVETVRGAKAGRTILVLGSNPVINSKEEIDRTTLELPPAQQRLAEAVLAEDPDTVIVLVTNYPYSICDLQHKAKAILLSASGSQELGIGIATVLSGRANPAGRLNMTWYLSEQDLPDISDYDIRKGKRTYQYFDREVLYPFGHGLSYTEFSYGEIGIEQQKEEILVRTTVTNIGESVGDEVVQLYIHKSGSRVCRPISQLKGFERLKAVMPGETREILFRVKRSDLAYYDVISGRMLVEDGSYIFMTGASSKDIRQKAELILDGETAGSRNPYAETMAEAYDDYENCFIHRGIGNGTCVIPGRAGDEPDRVDAIDRTEGCLLYRDFSFEKKPSGLYITLQALQDGFVHVRLFCEREEEQENSQNVEVEIPVYAGKGFDKVYTTLPEMEGTTASWSMELCVKGKIKISHFIFE